jgi:hypothetical protein
MPQISKSLFSLFFNTWHLNKLGTGY